jgi:Spy/CpxP family protein refolding chaperone
MKNALKKLIAVGVVALMAASPLAYAEPQGGGPGGDGPGYEGAEPKGFFKELNLTQEQKDKLKAQRESKREANKALREQLKTKMQALHQEIAKPGTKEADVAGLVAEVNSLKAQMFSQMIDGVFAMKEILTPEQFAKMQAKHQERMNKMKERWGKKGPGAGPDEE